METERNTTLGQFLRARRALVRPEQAGLTTQGHRQVPGLRRDEVARLAGLSVGHYARLEQRHERPTRQTVANLGRALRLDEGAMVELHRLARPVVSRRPGSRIERVAPHVLGELHLRTEVFPIASASGQRLIAQPADPGSRSAETLALLGTLAA